MVSRRGLLVGAAGTGVAAVVFGGGYSLWAHSTYSHGFRMGKLTSFYSDARFMRGYTSTGEGELFLGFDSGQAQWRGSDGQTVTNPWRFSTSEEIFKKYRHLIGKMVVVQYRQLMAPMTSFGGNTDYRADDIALLDPSLVLQPAQSSARLRRTDGGAVGRIVKLTSKGNVFSSYECTIQIGPSSFREASIVDEAVYTAALNYLKSGKQAMITLNSVIIRDPMAQNSNLTIVGLKPQEA